MKRVKCNALATHLQRTFVCSFFGNVGFVGMFGIVVFFGLLGFLDVVDCFGICFVFWRVVWGAGKVENGLIWSGSPF